MNTRTTLGQGLALLFALGLPAQELRWQVPAPPSADSYLRLYPFGDYNQDGYRDVVAVILANPPAPTYPWVQIRSGLDGSILLQQLEQRFRNITHAGDMDGDGSPDLAVLWDWGNGVREVFLRSPATGQTLWSKWGNTIEGFGDEMLGDLDVNGDGRLDLIVATSSFTASGLFVYDHTGTLLYTKNLLAKGRLIISLAKMGDMDGDGADDFLVGSNDTTNRGALDLMSGKTGSKLRTSYGLLPGDLTSQHVSNLGDIDGDGVNDYAGFPYWSANNLSVVAYSGASGNVIRSWFEYANSAVCGEDFDQDGVNDLVMGADWPIVPPNPNVYGRTHCYSGRDGTELWRVSNFQSPQGTGSNGTSGWMEYSASLGVQPGNPYPVIAWMDIQWHLPTTYDGRIRAYGMERAGQGPVIGVACTSSGPLPLIGARKTTTGSRITIAKSHPNAIAGLWLSFTALPQPFHMTPFGFNGCQIQVAPDAAWLRILGTTGIDRGYAAVDLPYQLAPAGLGLAIVAQWLVLAPTTGDYAATQMHALRLQ